MYVNVEIEVTNSDKINEVLRSIFTNQQSGVLYEKNVLKIRLFYKEDSVQAAIQSICECGTITYLEYNYSTQNKDSSEEEIKKEVITSSQSTENTEKKTPHEEKAATSPQKSEANNVIVIPELEKLSENVSSADEYINKVADFLGIPDGQKPIFAGLVAIYPEVKKNGKATWENLSNALENHGIRCNSYEKKLMINAVTEKLNIKFLKVVAMISDVLGKINFDNSKATESEQEAQNSKEAENSDSTEKNQKPQDTQKEPPKETDTRRNQEKLFPCMPDKIAGEGENEELVKLEEQLCSIDKTVPMKEKIKQAITILIGQQRLSFKIENDRLEGFIRFTQRALSTESVTFDNDIVNPENLPENAVRIYILYWSTIAQMYDPNIKAIDFLENLREVLK